MLRSAALSLSITSFFLSFSLPYPRADPSAVFELTNVIFRWKDSLGPRSSSDSCKRLNRVCDFLLLTAIYLARFLSSKNDSREILTEGGFLTDRPLYCTYSMVEFY